MQIALWALFLLSNGPCRYLQQVVSHHKSQEPAIHNYLLSLYAKQPEEAALLRFLDSPYIDLKYALRLCMRLERRQACIRIYSKMELFEEAVESALLWGDVEVAKVYPSSMKGAHGSSCISMKHT